MNPDLKFRLFKIRGKIDREAAIFYLDGITNNETIQNHLLSPLLHVGEIEKLEDIVFYHLSILDAIVVRTINEILSGLSKGKTLVLIDGFNEGILADTSDWQKRAISEPDTQRSIKGPLVSFNEQLKNNINLLRNMAQTHQLSVESY
ncbi:hypothetical protein CN601_16890 [Bacillus sp. AFS017336]|nr:hypothetical protein CN692_12110 [Bacillus sp. AFS002410]PEL08395.1 hypothetical protein CN601_16890 [Bacillus sp. AFS017336]